MFDYVVKEIKSFLKTRKQMPSIIDEIAQSVSSGKVAFYPCSRYSNAIIEKIQKQKPQLAKKILAIFDPNDKAISGAGIPVYGEDALFEKGSDFDVIVIAANNYYENCVQKLRDVYGFGGKIIPLSAFETTLPNGKNDEIIQNITKVYNLLKDYKSKITYLLTWLSRIHNDASLISIFRQDNTHLTTYNNVLEYKNYKIYKLTKECAEELVSELYVTDKIYPKEGDTVFDIGGYKGDTAIYFADKVGPNGKVYVFEPTWANFNDLTYNVNVNNMQDIILPIQKGMSDKAGYMKMCSLDSGVPWAFFDELKGAEQVVISTIDDAFKNLKLSRLDYIKMDVEGFELDVLRGGEKTIKDMKPQMVIPLYHNLIDFIDIPLWIDKLGGYDLYIRSKIDGPWGINLYCTPLITNGKEKYGN